MNPPEYLDAREAEAYCLSEAFLWVDSMQHRDVIFETDAKNVVEAMLKPKLDYGSLTTLCSSLLEKNK